LAASHLPRGSRSRPRGRPRGCRNDQTRQPSVLRTAGQHLRLLAAKDRVNVFLYGGAIVPDPAGIITGGHENKSARTLSIRQGEHIGGRTLPGRRRPLARALRPGSGPPLREAEGVMTLLC